MSNRYICRYIWVTLALILVAGAIFAVWPDLDLMLARQFWTGGQFAGRTSAARALRNFFYFAPLVVALAMALFWLLSRLGLEIPARLVPANRSMIFLAVSLLLAPGLLVNVVLKEVSARPRPNQVENFGGSAEFRPWHRFDGACRSNCSFVSGEVSASAWLAAPASLLPPPWQAPAVAAAIVFAAATGALRMAFGGHFLSDVVFAILLTLLLVQLLRRLILRPAAP